MDDASKRTIAAAIDLLRGLARSDATVTPPLRGDTLGEQAEAIYSARRRRADRFGGLDLFGEPAYDILLDLFIQRAKGRSVSISSACVAADVPPTTALRHLEKLVFAGLVQRTDDQLDLRRSWVELTDKAVRWIEFHLSDYDRATRR